MLFAGLRGMGQVPFEPPSVGGWPTGEAWLTTTAALARLTVVRTAVGAAKLPAEIASAAPEQRPEAIRRLLGVDAWSARTTQAIARVAADPPTAVSVAACSPEYVVSA